LAELHFNAYETDLVERELGYVMAFDHDLDMFAASIGLTKTSVAAIIKEEGDLFLFFYLLLTTWLTLCIDVVLDMGGYDVNKELFDPLDKLLSRCKSAKTVSK
jgi:dynactin 1